MRLKRLHSWAVTPSQAIDLQRRLAARVERVDRQPQPLRRVAGVDVSYPRQGGRFYAAVVVLALPELQQVDAATAVADSPFPYIPGLLSFRELPVLLQAFRRLQTLPDVVLVDGQGIAHPRRLGLASHLGLWLERPTIGCAKSRLCGEHPSPGTRRGDQVPLLLEGEVLGTVLTTRDGVKPLYVSPGHQVDLAGAVQTVLACGGGYRLPEPTRLAHRLCNALRSGDLD